MKIYPAILSDAVAVVSSQLEISSNLENVETVQIDVIDGRFADNMTVTPLDLINLDFKNLQIDFHLMVEEPMDYLNEILDCQDSLPVRAVIAHIERMTDQLEFVKAALDNKIKAGLSLDLVTPVEEIEPNVLSELDFIQLMGIEAGFQGQKLQPLVFDKIKQLVQIKQAQSAGFELIVDGGVKQDNLQQLKDLQVEGVAIGSWLWNNDDPQSLVDLVINN